MVQVGCKYIRFPSLIERNTVPRKLGLGLHPVCSILAQDEHVHDNEVFKWSSSSCLFEWSPSAFMEGIPQKMIALSVIINFVTFLFKRKISINPFEIGLLFEGECIKGYNIEEKVVRAIKDLGLE